jgi:acetyltransferase-like isoleucine patch superfamily enzyme
MLGDDGATIKLAKRSTLDIRGIVRLGVGTLVIVDPGALVEIGGKTFVTGNSSILCAERVSMGEECAIAWNVLIMDSDFHRISNRETMTRPIKIGNHVWIGCGVTILKGVNVGEGAVIAAAALVASDVPPHSLVAGNPARVVRSNVEWSKS